MRKVLLLIIFYFFGSNAPAYAQSSEECTLDIKELSSNIDDSSPSVKTLSAPKIDEQKRSITHVIQINSGAKVKFFAGGCVHYHFSYAFSQLRQMPKNNKELFDYIRSQIRLVPVKEGEAEVLMRMIDNLEQASYKPKNWQTPTSLNSPFGAAYIYLTIEDKGFTLSYDFPL